MPRRRLDKRQVLFRVIAALLVFGVIELAAAIAVGFMERSGLSLDVSEYAGAATVDSIGNPKLVALHGLGFEYDEVTHPYVGFVLTSSDPKLQDLKDVGWIEPSLYKRSPERVIIALTGGSVARQLWTQGGKTLRQELASSERFKGKEIVFVGLCLGGYKQPQQLMILNYLLSLGGEFDVIINLDGFNEVALHEPENGAHGIFPIFPRWWHSRINDVANAEDRANAGELAYLQRQLREIQHSPFTRVMSYLQVGKLWRAFRIKRLHREISLVVERTAKPDAGVARRLAATGPRWKFTEDELYDHLVGIWSRGSLQMHWLSQGNGIKYFHFLQPNQYVEGTKTMGKAERKRAYDPKMRFRTGVVKGYPKLIEAGKELAEQGVAYTDLTRIFAEVDEPMYFDTCCHVTDEGSQMLAKAVARRVIEGL